MIDSLQAQIETFGVHPALGPTGSGWGIEQNPWELAYFLAYLTWESRPVKTILELGTGYMGGLSRFLADILHYEVTTVDINPAVSVASKARRLLMTTSAAAEILDSQTFDVVFIDAAHDYLSVASDHRLFKDRGRIVAFHDIAGLRSCYGSASYWKGLAYREGILRIGFYEAIAPDEFAAGIGWYNREEING